MEATNLILRIAPLSPTFNGTPQEFVDHFVDRAEILSPSGFYNVVVADAAPTSNQGLLLLGGTKVYVWDTGTSAYIPANIYDSLDIPATGKYFFVADGGSTVWKSIADLWTWLNFTAGTIPPGANGTILASVGGVSGWQIPDVALPDASVPVDKLQATVDDVNKVARVQPSGAVAWATLPTLAASVQVSAELAVPDAGLTQPFTRPGGTFLLRVILKKVAEDPNNPEYPIGCEVDVAHFDTPGNNSTWSTFSVSEQATSWVLCRTSLTGYGPGDLIVVARRNEPNGLPVYIDEAQWRVKFYYM